MTQPSISVAMCTYNGARYLEKQLESIGSQEIAPDELIVCDDISTDRTKAQLETFARSAPFEVTVVHNPLRLGTVKNFEKAISLCRSEVIALSDQDDIWEPRKLASLRDAFADPSVTAAFSDGALIGPNEEDVGYSLWEAVELHQARLERWDETQIARLPRMDLVTGAALAFRRSLTTAVLPLPNGWGHDAWIALIAAAVGRLVPIPEKLIKYRLHAEQQVGLSLPQPDSLHAKLAMKRYRLAMIRRARTDRSALFSHISTSLGEVEERFRELQRTRPVHPALASAVRGWVGHFRARFEIPNDPSHVRTAWQELRLGHYHRYSNGFSSFAKDVALRGPKRRPREGT